MSGFAVNGLNFRAVNGPDDVLPGEQYSESPPLIVGAVTGRMVDAERDRRIDSDFLFNGIVFQCRPADRENITGAAQLAFMAISAGAKTGNLRWLDEGKDFTWIAADNSQVPMDAHDVVRFAREVASRKQSLIYLGRRLKDMDVIPDDYASEKWWLISEEVN
ncbi:DUF4376 domain-containing protein [Metapseudomonas otitidis]|uniref:DUF4376 domain-containing protein n=1 Tax=Metapseudomonas otitidis TaxID=319939 RepID=UPI00244A8D21|nr:DUF4376 domain-containing protein [Pseudomonas otitidis]MDG9784625.1 DUF4376 domain-containing protein [Pseudomonas otitidis]